jgi:small ligand-binding sensory domain FIST
MASPPGIVAIGAGLSSAADARAAGREAALDAVDDLGPDGVDLAFLFLSADHLDEAAAVADAVRETARPGNLVGCVSAGVLAGDRELESGPGVAVWAARLPGAAIQSFHAVAVDDGVAGVPELDDVSLVALLVDPFSFPAVPFLDAVNARQPGVPLVGGLATGAGRPGGQALILDREVHDEGAVGVAVSGVPVVTLVSQGCAPLGPESVVTRAEGNVVFELAGRPALERLREVVGGLSESEQRVASEGLLAGLVIDENKSEYGRDDYLMRGVLGADEESGALAIGGPVRVGQTLRFHARDAGSADEDLRRALAGGIGGANAAGALMFTCNGRGRGLFQSPDHDARLVSGALAGEGLAGFFCGGEIGPVGGRAFLHGFTATLAVFLESPRASKG